MSAGTEADSETIVDVALCQPRFAAILLLAAVLLSKNI
jgi:hypothetical protein